MNDEFSYVYILVDKNQQRVKIGKADNVIRRIKSLECTWGQFDLKKSIQIQCKQNYVYKLEKILHNIFDSWNITLEEKIDGHTEWFDISCLENINSVLSMIKNIHIDNIIITKGIKSPTLNKKETNCFNDLSKIERKKYREDKKKREIIDYYKYVAGFEITNIQTAHKLIDLLLSIEDKVLSINTTSHEIVYKNTNFIQDIFFTKIGNLSKLLYDDSKKNKNQYKRLNEHSYRVMGDSAIFANEEDRIYVKIDCNFQHYIKYQELRIPLRILSDYFYKTFGMECLSREDCKNNIIFEKLTSFLKVNNENNFAKITSDCGAIKFINQDFKYNHDSGEELVSYTYDKSFLYDSRPEYYENPYYVIYIPRVSYIMCEIKKNEIFLWVCYTEELEREKNYMTILLTKLIDRYPKYKIVVDTYNKKLKKICLKFKSIELF